jgi:hypothetical protein
MCLLYGAHDTTLHSLLVTLDIAAMDAELHNMPLPMTVKEIFQFHGDTRHRVSTE